MRGNDKRVAVGCPLRGTTIDTDGSRLDEIEGRVENFARQVVEHPTLKRCHTIMQNLQRAARQRRSRRAQHVDESQPLGPPRGMLVTGLTGTGKTTISTHYMARYPRYDAEDRTVIPVLFLELPSEPRANVVSERLLHALGDPYAKEGSGALRMERAKTLIRRCEIDLIMIGEVQHFTDNLDSRARDVTGDAFKDLMNVGVPTVFFALPSARAYFIKNQQLGRRCTPKLHLRPFGVVNADERNEFLGVLMSLHHLLPMAGPSALIDTNCALAFHFASFGLFGQLSQLIEEALRIALIAQDSMLRREHLKVAFEQTIFPGCRDSRNPFSAKFNDKPLTGPDEPYHGLVA